MRSLPIVLLVAVALGAAGCASDGAAIATTADQDPSDSLAESIASALDAIEGDGAIVFTSTEAGCVADSVIGAVSSDRLIELGADQGPDLTGLEWTADERSQVMSSMRECADLQAQLADFFATDPSLAADQARCIAEMYLDSTVFPGALFSTMPDPELNSRIDAQLSTVYQSCA